MALNNKLGITDSPELAREEERISKKKALELFQNGLLETFEVGKFIGLSKIHEFLFCDIYDFAGKIRVENLAKGNFRFAPVMYLEAALKNIDNMPQSTFDKIIEKYVEMNIAHPFRDGNGRVGRLIMFRECLKHDVVPFIIDEIHKMYYYRGLKEFADERGYLMDTCLSAQDKYKTMLDYFEIDYHS